MANNDFLFNRSCLVKVTCNTCKGDWIEVVTIPYSDMTYLAGVMNEDCQFEAFDILSYCSICPMYECNDQKDNRIYEILYNYKEFRYLLEGVLKIDKHDYF